MNNYFWKGFEKRAIDPDRATAEAVAGGIIGMILTGTAASIHYDTKSKKAIEEFKNLPNQHTEDAEKVFKKLKKYCPEDTVLITPSILRKSKYKDDRIIKRLAKSLEVPEGAFAIHPEMGGATSPGGVLFKQFPDKKIVGSSDKTSKSIMAHEIGHLIDYDKIEKQKFLKKFYNKSLRNQVKKEEAAWDLAPEGPYEGPDKDLPLQTYKNHQKANRVTLAGTSIGAATPAVVSALSK